MFQVAGVPTLVTGLVAIDALTTGVAVVSYLSLHRAHSASSALDHTYLPAVRTLKRLQRDLSETRVLARGIFIHRMTGRTHSAETEHDELLRLIDTTRRHMAAYESLAPTPAELEEWGQFLTTWEHWRLLLGTYVETLKAGHTDEAYDIVFGPSADCMASMNDSLQTCIDLNFTYADAAEERAAATCRFTDVTVGLASALSVVLAVGIGFSSGLSPAAIGRLLGGSPRMP